MAKRSPCKIPILLLSTQADLLTKTAVELLVRGNYPNVHVAIRIPSSAPRWRHVKSCTILPPAAAGDKAVLDALQAFSRQIGAAALLPVRTDDVLFVAQHQQVLAEFHPVPVPDPQLLRTVSSKLSFTRLAESLGLPVPRTVACQPHLNAATIASQLGLPLLAKPVIGESGSGIRRVATIAELRSVIEQATPAEHFFFQEEMRGEDVALTLLADRGDVFAVAIRKRWFHRANTPPFSPLRDVEYIHDGWLEALGRSFVHATRFSGIADFDLKVDFERQQAWFLECDPRLMGTMLSMALFGVNIPQLLVDHALGKIPLGSCRRTETGHALSLHSLPDWLVSGAWREPRHGPLRIPWRNVVNLPIAAYYRMRHLFIPRR